MKKMGTGKANLKKPEANIVSHGGCNIVTSERNKTSLFKIWSLTNKSCREHPWSIEFLVKTKFWKGMLKTSNLLQFHISWRVGLGLFFSSNGQNRLTRRKRQPEIFIDWISSGSCVCRCSSGVTLVDKCFPAEKSNFLSPFKMKRFNQSQVWHKSLVEDLGRQLKVVAAAAGNSLLPPRNRGKEESNGRKCFSLQREREGGFLLLVSIMYLMFNPFLGFLQGDS